MKTLLLFCALSAGLPAQEFVVASIHPAKDDGSHDSDVDSGILRIHNLSLKRLVASAWRVKDAEVLGGPNWLDSATFDITAKIPAEYVNARPSKVPEMLQKFLTDEFHVAVHRESRQVSGYVLVVAKKGSKMKPADPGLEDSHTQGSGHHLSATNVSMEQLATRLSRVAEIGAIVEDKTGLTGRFNFELDWLPDRGVEKLADEPPSIFTALQDSLGLKLEGAKVPVEAVVVDRAEKPQGN